MITVKIGGDARDYSRADAQWVGQQIHGLQRDNLPVCVRVKIEEGPINFTLVSSACGGGGGDWRPNTQEQRIIDLWIKHHLDKPQIQVGYLVSFLRELGRLVS